MVSIMVVKEGSAHDPAQGEQPPSDPVANDNNAHDTNKANNGNSTSSFTNHNHHILADIAPNIPKNDSVEDSDYAEINFDIPPPEHDENNPEHIRHREIIATIVPTTELEIALKAELDCQVAHNLLISGECTKLRGFISKRKQVYKRKRKDETAPKKKLSGYNLFVRERFARVAKENEEALKNSDSGAELKRIPPASNIASSGHAWSQLNPEEKARYNDMAKPDEDRYQKETASYNPPESMNRKRNKTGYNVFFSRHVLELKRGDSGVPSERGSVARIVGDAWKKMNAEERDEYEREADDHNETHSSVERHVPHAPMPLHEPQHMMPDGAMGVMPLMPPGMQHPPPMVMPMELAQNPMLDGSMPPDGMPPPTGMPPPYPPDYGMHGPPPPVIHQPPGYDGYYGGPPPPYDPYAYPPPMYPGMPPGMPPPPGTEGMLPYGPPPPGYQGPPPPYVDM